MTTGPATVLLSGGIDSTCLVAHYLEAGLDVEALFIDWGQPARSHERTAVAAVAHKYQISMIEIECAGLSFRSQGEVIGRNAFFLTAALLARPRSPLIGIGLHSGTGYSDSTPEFVRSVQSVYDIYTGGSCRLDAPFLELTKDDVYRMARSLDVPLADTYSCDLGLRQPCGDCRSCADVVDLWNLHDARK